MEYKQYFQSYVGNYSTIKYYKQYEGVHERLWYLKCVCVCEGGCMVGMFNLSIIRNLFKATI